MSQLTSEGFDLAKQHAGGTNKKLGELLGCTKQLVGKWKGVIPPKWAIRLEEKTGGKLTRWELRPDHFGQPPKKRRAA